MKILLKEATTHIVLCDLIRTLDAEESAVTTICAGCIVMNCGAFHGWSLRVMSIVGTASIPYQSMVQLLTEDFKVELAYNACLHR